MNLITLKQVFNFLEWAHSAAPSREWQLVTLFQSILSRNWMLLTRNLRETCRHLCLWQIECLHFLRTILVRGSFTYGRPYFSFFDSGLSWICSGFCLRHLNLKAVLWFLELRYDRRPGCHHISLFNFCQMPLQFFVNRFPLLFDHS